jgi:hypothetical protein
MNVALGNGLDNVKPIAGGFTQVAVTDTAALVDASITLNAKTTHVLCQCKGKALVERLDGTAPTASVGIVRELGEKWVWTRAELQVAQVISTDASGSTLNIQQYRDR